jgi:hypothetical protein
MAPISHITRWSPAVIAVALISSCAPSCVPTPGASPAPAVTTTAPAASTLTVTYDGAGPNVARIGLIGDSTMASIRWTGAYAPLRRWNYTYDAESCRRTITVSCHGSDGYAPANALDTMRRLSGQLGVVLVMMMGANDPANRFGEGIDAVVAEARAQGITNVIWLTVHGAADRNAILTQRAQQYGGYLLVADWAGYSAGHPEWVVSDGLHLSATGAPVLSQFIADSVAGVLGS